jgi:hypothetical protein
MAQSDVKQTEFDFVEQIEKKQDATLQGLVDWCDLTNLIDLGYVANPQNPSNDKRLPVYGITDDQVNLFAMIVWMGEGHSTEGCTILDTYPADKILKGFDPRNYCTGNAAWDPELGPVLKRN